jgi:hypothetical protein
VSFEGNGCGAHFGDAHGFIIGCPAPDACNLIPGNDRFGASSYGVWLQNSSSANTVEGNLFGTDKNSPESSLNSNYDVKIDGSGNAMAGDGAARNTIAFNGATECKYSAPVSASSETTPITTADSA